jgi:hypothetical protein
MTTTPSVSGVVGESDALAASDEMDVEDYIFARACGACDVEIREACDRGSYPYVYALVRRESFDHNELVEALEEGINATLFLTVRRQSNREEMLAAAAEFGSGGLWAFAAMQAGGATYEQCSSALRSPQAQPGYGEAIKAGASASQLDSAMRQGIAGHCLSSTRNAVRRESTTSKLCSDS